MTRLRKMMLEELQRRNFSEDTIRHYIRTVEDFARHFNRPQDRLGLRHMLSSKMYRLTFNGKQYSVEVVIRSFRCSDTERLFRRELVRRFKAMERQALRKLDLLDAAPDVRTLSTFPGNRLEKLKGDREGQYGIRVNEQRRICFKWGEGHAHEVEIANYH